MSWQMKLERRGSFSRSTQVSRTRGPWPIAAQRLLLALVALAALGTTPLASGQAVAGRLRAAMVMDANTGEILHEQDGDAPRLPASLTKMMTLYMVFEGISRGRWTYETPVKISAQAAAAPPSKLDLDPGDTIRMIDAIRALVTKSANDVAVAVAEHISGTEPAFARLMTQRARQIGMTSTTFRNASGLPNHEQTSTARDMLTLALRLQDEFPRQYKLFSTRTFNYAGSRYRNHNNLLRNFSGTDGIKTGYTRASGFNLVASVRRDGKHVIGVVFGGRTAKSRDAQMRTMLTRSLRRASTQRTRKPLVVARANARPPPPPVQRPDPPATVVGTGWTIADDRSVQATAAAIRPPQPMPAPRSGIAAAPFPVPQPVQIAVARVRSVPLSAPPSAQAAAPAASMISRAAPQPYASPAGSRETVVAKRAAARARNGDGPDRQAALISRGWATPELGRPPSTLQQQAAALAARERGVQMAATPRARAALPRPPAATGRATGASVAATGRYHIQVGAYATTEEADRQLASVRAKAGSLLSTNPSLTMPVVTSNRRLYRARYAGFDATSAQHACQILQLQNIACFAVRAQ